jgi:DNA-binding MarR family transcriptional regulator
VKPPVAKEEIPDLEAKLLAIINEHPKGITLAEVAERLDVAPVVLSRASRSLLDKGRIRREEKLYFPVRSE